MAVNLINLPKALSNPKHTVEPVWASDAGRNSNSGKFSGTFVGWFDTLEIPIGETTQAEMTTIKNAIENPIIENVSFVDSKTGNIKTENFYGTAITAERLNSKRYKPFSFSLKAIEARDDM